MIGTVEDPPERTTPPSLDGWIVILCLLIIYIGVWNIQVVMRVLGIEVGPTGPASILIWNWIAVGAVFLFVLGLEGRPLSSIGLGRPTATDIGWAFVFWIVSLVATMVIHSIASPPPSEGMDEMLALGIPVLMGVIITASITEEIVYRGLLIERLREVSGSLWVGVLISLGLFIYPHIQFFGPHWLLFYGHSAILIYVLYVLRRNLWACMVLHVLYNALILLPALGIE